MFASPAIHVYSQENTDTVPKKPGVTNSLSRKPFIDRAVNGTSPDNKNLKSDSCLKKPGFKSGKRLTPQKTTTEDDLFLYDSYSYKDIKDNYLDIKCLTQKDTLNILQSYCNYSSLRTPPPELSSDFELFIEIPESNLFLKSEDSFENQNFEESIEDISLPGIDLDNLD